MADREITGDELDRARQLLETRWQALGFKGLHQFEQDWVVTWWLKIEVENGSFHQYFFNSAGDMALQAVAALDRLEQHETQGILNDALVCFGTPGYSAVREERQRRLTDLSGEAFADVTEAFNNRTEEFDVRALIEVLLSYERLRIQ